LIKSIVNFLLTTIFRSLEALPYLPLLPIILRNIVDDQIRHMSYVSQRGFNSSYDYVVIGAGSGGAVMASRLSEDPSVSVLLLEAGSAENFISDVPEICLLLQKTPLDWGYESTPQKKSCRGLDNQRLPLARGKVMGGCSTLNAMIYVRGNPRDYDTWAAKGATNWSWKDVFPYFIKSEDNQDQDYLANGYHGKGGPLAVTSVYVPRWSTNAFQEAGAYLGYPTGDVNGKSQSHFTLTQRTIRDGKRCSVANAYLETLAANRPNLKVLIRSHVTRIVFDNTKRATGVQFEINSVKHTVNVRKEVILSAGAINSPQILMLSGIERNGIQSILSIDFNFCKVSDPQTI
jgi:glucose dehydrogenase (acceptor)